MTEGLALGIGEVIGVLSLFALFYHQIYSLNDAVGSASESISDIREDINKVDLKNIENHIGKLSDIERDIEKVSYNIADQPVEGGNSVLYELESCDNKVVISIASDTIERDLVRIYGDKLSENINIETLISQKLGIPELSRDTVKEASEDRDNIEFYESGNIPDEFEQDMDIVEEDVEAEAGAEITIDREDFLDIEGLSVEMDVTDDGELNYQLTPSDLTVVHFDFENKINVKSVVGRMNSDEEVEHLERELFTHEGYFSDRSPYEIIYVIASDDYEKIAKIIDVLVDKIEEYHQAFEEESKRFDEAVEAELFEQ